MLLLAALVTESTRHGRRYRVVKQAETDAMDFRAKAQALTTGFSGSLHKSFKDYNDAVAYMNAHGKVDFFVDPELPPIRTLSGKKHYAVANGRAKGVFETYE
jgi:hypothetical protein